MTGALQLANKTPNPAGDDSFFGDADVGGSFCVKGAQNAPFPTGITLIEQNEEWGSETKNYAKISYDGTNVNISKPLITSVDVENSTDSSLQNSPLIERFLGRVNISSTNLDLNTLTRQGFYTWDNTSKNTPVDGSWGQVMVVSTVNNTTLGSNPYITQVAFPTDSIGDAFCFIRKRVVGTAEWQEWHKISQTYSPTFTGIPQAPTPALGNNSQQIANTSWVNQTIDNLEAEWVVLMDTWIGTGDIKLSESWRNFDEIIVWTTYDDKNIVCAPTIISSVLLKAFFDDGIASYWDLYTGGSYWRIARAGSTDTLWKLNGENVGIRRIYGVRKKKSALTNLMLRTASTAFPSADSEMHISRTYTSTVTRDKQFEVDVSEYNYMKVVITPQDTNEATLLNQFIGVYVDGVGYIPNIDFMDGNNNNVLTLLYPYKNNSNTTSYAPNITGVKVGEQLISTTDKTYTFSHVVDITNVKTLSLFISAFVGTDFKGCSSTATFTIYFSAEPFV